MEKTYVTGTHMHLMLSKLARNRKWDFDFYMLNSIQKEVDELYTHYKLPRDTELVNRLYGGAVDTLYSFFVANDLSLPEIQVRFHEPYLTIAILKWEGERFTFCLNLVNRGDMQIGYTFTIWDTYKKSELQETKINLYDEYLLNKETLSIIGNDLKLLRYKTLPDNGITNTGIWLK